MKKLLVMGCMLLGSVQAFGKASSTTTLTSDYVWRGISYSQAGAPAVQGTIDYAMDNGVSFGAWGSNLTSALGGYELGQYVGYTFGEELMGLSVTVNNHNFTLAQNFNAQEVVLGLNVAGAKIQFAYMPNYFGFETTHMWANVDYSVQIAENLKFAPTVAMVSFGDEKKVLMSNYFYYKLGLQYSNEGWTTEIAFLDTNRQAVDAAGTKTDIAKDEKTYVSLSKSF